MFYHTRFCLFLLFLIRLGFSWQIPKLAKEEKAKANTSVNREIVSGKESIGNRLEANPELDADEVENLKAALLRRMGLDEEPEDTATPRHKVPLYMKAVHALFSSHLNYDDAGARNIRALLPDQEKEGQNLRLIFSGILPDRALEEYSHAELVLRLRGKRRASAANRSLSLFVRMSGTGWEKIIGKQRRLGDIRGFWVAFDLSKNLLKWRSEMRSVPSQSQSQSGSLALSVAIPFDENALRDLTHFSGSFEPILVLYTHDPEEILATSVALQMDPSRARRSVPVPNGVVAGSGASDCSLKPWSVSFDQLGWGALVITPTSLEANSCEGTCETSHMNNHAFLKTVYLSRHSRHTDLSGACCVPAKLRPISILFSTNGTIYLKQMPDMIAEECHCL